MIPISIYEEALFQTIKRGATVISPDVEKGFLDAIDRETHPGAKRSLEATLKSMRMSEKRENPLCDLNYDNPIEAFDAGFLYAKEEVR